MARVLFTSARQDGLVLPLLHLVRAMADRGDSVWFLSGEAYRERIEAAGATFVQVPYDDAVPAESEAIDRGGGLRGISGMLRDLFLDPVETDFTTVRRLTAELGIDLIVTEPLYFGSTAIGLLPRSERPGVLTIGCIPLPFASPDVPPFGLGLAPIDGPLNQIRNSVLTVVADLVVTGSVRRALQHKLRRLTGVEVTGSLFDLPLTADVYAHTSVKGFEYPRRSLSRKVRFIGPLPAPSLFDLPSWWNYGDRRRIVHVTQGTYANGDLTELIVPTIRALADEDLLVVATTGGPDPAEVTAAYGGPLPANCRVERFMPYDHLLASASVMVTNGGFGSVHHAMRRGLPLVVAGRSEDRADVNARVAWSGIGIDLTEQRPTVEAIRTAVLAVLGDEALHRRAAARLGAAVAATDPVGDVLRIADELTAEQPPHPARNAGHRPRTPGRRTRATRVSAGAAHRPR